MSNHRFKPFLWSVKMKISTLTNLQYKIDVKQKTGRKLVQKEFTKNKKKNIYIFFFSVHINTRIFSLCVLIHAFFLCVCVYTHFFFAFMYAFFLCVHIKACVAIYTHCVFIMYFCTTVTPLSYLIYTRIWVNLSQIVGARFFPADISFQKKKKTASFLLQIDGFQCKIEMLWFLNKLLLHGV